MRKAAKRKFKKNPFSNPNGDHVDDKMITTSEITIPFPNQGKRLKMAMSKRNRLSFFPSKRCAIVGKIINAIMMDEMRANVLV